MPSDSSDSPGASANRSSKPWASGRTLTEAQRARKRDADRAGHRERRQKTQKRILELEAKLESLTREPATEKVAQLMCDIERLKSENKTLLQCLESRVFVPDPQQDTSVISSVEDSNIYGTPTPSGSNQASDDPQVLPWMSSSSPKMFEGAGYVAFPDCEMDSPTVYPVESPVPDSVFNMGGVSNLQANQSLKSYLAVDKVKKNLIVPRPSIHEVGNSIGPLSIANRCNMILSQVQKLSAEDICIDDKANQNFLILAIMEGWEIAESRLTFCPLWTILREIDCLIFWVSNTVERVVMLRMIHCMLICMVKAQTFDELPLWYRPRPAQQRFRHEMVMSYFAWPGFRERLVLSQHAILTDEFWDAFGRYFRFYWPFEKGDVFEKDKWTGNYRFSGCFDTYIREIRMWRMDLDFFTKFPMLVDDFMPQESIPQFIYHDFNKHASWVPTEYRLPPEVLDENVSEDGSVEQFASFDSIPMVPDSSPTQYFYPAHLPLLLK